MAILVLDDSDRLAVDKLRIEHLQVRRVDAADELLDASHDLLMRVFDPSVVDPKFVYVNAVTDLTGTFRDFPAQFFAGLFADGENEWLAGFISSDLMRIGESNDLQLAIGNIATSPKLLELGFRGVGSTLWHAAINSAREVANHEGMRLGYSTSEAEPASLKFWAKLGYRWPKGVKYFQPPLEFDERGNPEHEEVPETLLVHPLDSSKLMIDVSELREMIQAIYWNWGVRPSIRRLDDAALSRAKEYVLEHVLSKTMKSLPNGGAVPLVDVPVNRVH
jgi:hypothetical protein